MKEKCFLGLCFIIIFFCVSCSDDVGINIEGSYPVTVHYTYRQVPQSISDTDLVHYDSTFLDTLIITQDDDRIVSKALNHHYEMILAYDGQNEDTLNYIEKYPYVNSVLGHGYLNFNTANSKLVYHEILGSWHGPVETIDMSN